MPYTNMDAADAERHSHQVHERTEVTEAADDTAGGCVAAAARCNAAEHARGDDPIRHLVRARQCVRSAARKGDDAKAVDPETVDKVANVHRPVTHAAVGVRFRVADAGTLQRDEANIALLGNYSCELRDLTARARRAVEPEDRIPRRDAVLGEPDLAPVR